MREEGGKGVFKGFSKYLVQREKKTHYFRLWGLGPGIKKLKDPGRSPGEKFTLRLSVPVWSRDGALQDALHPRHRK